MLAAHGDLGMVAKSSASQLIHLLRGVGTAVLYGRRRGRGHAPCLVRRETDGIFFDKYISFLSYPLAIASGFSFQVASQVA